MRFNFFQIYFILIFIFSSIYYKTFSQFDQNISNTHVRETEPFIAINPINTDNIIVSWMSVSYPQKIVSKASFDGGLTWGNINELPHFSDSPYITSADVSIAFNKFGEAYICYLDLKSTLDSGYVRVAKSNNGGVSWGNPVNVMSINDDIGQPVGRPWIAIDQSNSAYSGKIYVVTKSLYTAPLPHKIWISTSNDNASTFSPLKQLDNPVNLGFFYNVMAVPTVGADGIFYCAYASWDTTQYLYPRYVCTKSTDGGDNFTQSTILHLLSTSSITDTLYMKSFTISANPSIAGNLIFQTVDARNGDPDILSVYSSNAGQTWSTPVKVNDDPAVNGKGQDLSWAAFSTTGNYAISWRDRRNGIPNSTSNYEIYTSLSFDNGVHFSPNYCLSSLESPFINLSIGNDFLGIALTPSHLFTIWSDNRNQIPNMEDIYIRKESIQSLNSVESSYIDSKKIIIYPNPTSGNVHINTHGKNIIFLDLYSPQGEFIKRYFTHEFSTLNLPNGLYFIIIETIQNRFIDKLIIQH